MRAKTRTTNETNSQSAPESLYTYEDVPLYAKVHYMGRTGWIIDKGEHIRSGNGRHLMIEYDQEEHGRKNSYLHENVVDRLLRNQERIWIDFGHLFSGNNN